MRTYTQTDELDAIMEELIATKEYHHDLHVTGAAIQVIFHFGGAGEALVHQGTTCLAYVESTPLRFRALGLKDATIIVDHASWEKFDDARRRALVDHELYHLAVKKNRKGDNVIDYLGRPKFAMRQHDIEVGWFAEIAKEHKEASIEAMQAGTIVENYRQTIFRFAALPAKAVKHKVKTH